MADLKSYEVEECRASFEVYDTTGGGKIDAIYLGSLLRAMDLPVTQEAVEKAGGTKKEGEKMIAFEDFLPIYSEAKKSKDIGQIEDLLEGLKVYDKNENGTMMAAELAHVLLSLGEKLTDVEVDEIFTSCCPPEDEDGYIKYERPRTSWSMLCRRRWLYIPSKERLFLPAEICTACPRGLAMTATTIFQAQPSFLKTLFAGPFKTSEEEGGDK